MFPEAVIAETRKRMADENATVYEQSIVQLLMMLCNQVERLAVAIELQNQKKVIVPH